MKLKRLARFYLQEPCCSEATATVSAEEKVADEITIWAWDEAFNIKVQTSQKKCMQKQILTWK